MKKIIGLLTMVALFAISPTQPADAKATLESLTQGEEISSFETEAVYLNQNGKRVGARFRHVPSQFVLDVLRIQSLPQAFVWVNTPPPTDQGEPHTLEHLLLGKGTKGRWVASYEDMALGQSSAYTEQIRTCYHYNTAAGPETFFKLFDAKLDAMIHPNYSDEEIRREVCNMGIKVNSEDGTKNLEEKGTVYNEMLSSFERPWGNLYFRLLKKVYGENHPLSYSAGGLPDAIRTMQPDDIKNFQQSFYHINNMGAVLAVGDEIELDKCLSNLSGILKKMEPNAKAGIDPANFSSSLPPKSPAPGGDIEVVGFPHQNENEPGVMVFAWPAERDLNPTDLTLFDMFISNLASGQTSNLYKRFIDSQTKRMDIGANSSFGWFDDENGQALFIGFSNVNRESTEPKIIDSVRTLVLNEIKSIAYAADNSQQLNEFNERLRSRVIERARDIKQFLNSPPRFGYRGSGSRWINHLQILNKAGGFERDLSMQRELQFIEKLLDSKKNFWKEYVTNWKLLTTKPYGMATRPDPLLITTGEQERLRRIDEFVDELKNVLKVEDNELAIASYESDYSKNTEIIDAEAATIEMPEFIDNPPLSLDDQLKYTTEKLPGGGDLVFSRFDNITSTTTGLSFDLYAIPESLLVFVPALPTVLTEIGVVKDGQPISYDEMSESIRREILELNAYFGNNFRTERSELTIRAAGSDRAESEKALNWLSLALYHPDLRAENLPRIKDAIDLNLKWLRNRMRGSEESWVNEPMYAYWRQNNPLLLSSGCFLTKTHSMHRLRWMLKDIKAGSADEAFFVKYMQLLSEELSALDRSNTESVLNSLASTEENTNPTYPMVTMLGTAPEAAKLLLIEAVKDLRLSLSEIPDNSLASDMAYLCKQITNDLKVKPAAALASIENMLNFLRHQDNVRGFVISSKVDKDALVTEVNEIVNKLDSKPSMKQEFPDSPLVAHRLKQRNPNSSNPIFVGLVNENTRSGVHINTTDCASYEDTDPETLLKFLSARLYGGGGAHSMFMKTWGAGLAYSNGLRSNENTGRLIYYAERCPDLAQTMQFVVDQLENAPYDKSLSDYAVSQAFAGIRSGSTYESRGEDMADDLADNLSPEVVRRFRTGILELRKNANLYDELHNRMEATYGEVLPGYGPSCTESAAKDNAIYFVIGPEKQLSTYEEYVKSVEGDVTLQRIYPRDFWITIN